MNNIIGIAMDKETAKRMIDEAPGDRVIFFCMEKSDSFVHNETVPKKKSEGKKLIDLAKEISYDDMEMFGVLSLYGEIASDKDILKNIAFPKIKKKKKKT